MKNRISTGALFAMLMLMAMLPRTGHSQEIDPNAYYEIVSSNNLVLDNQDAKTTGPRYSSTTVWRTACRRYGN